LYNSPQLRHLRRVRLFIQPLRRWSGHDALRTTARPKKTYAEEHQEQRKKIFKIEVVEEDELKNTAFSDRLDHRTFRSALTFVKLRTFECREPSV
jgi:hypothetical protein